MKTLAGIYFKRNFFFCLIFAVLLASCAPIRYETLRPSISPDGEFKGGRRYVVASWYGPGFHGRQTASGEIYNMHDYTCAHKELPFGTRLRVVNPQTAEEVICTVNDRGPFIPGRDLDLSYASARAISLIGPGVAEVIIEPLDRDMRYVRHIKYGEVGGTLTIQVGSFRDESNARRLKSALELRYKDVYIIEADVAGGRYYRVRVGRFSSASEAEMIGNALAEEGYNVLITRFEKRI
jgi:rare lipoprotein A